jgi:23S rRNA (adenine2030-N6)-methyltransferase
MKYRHAHHAGNFADVHKHVALLALIEALQRKDKGFLLLDTHAGRGSYELHTPGAHAHESDQGITRLLRSEHTAAPELLQYLDAVRHARAKGSTKHGYPGSPALALAALRAQDRAIFCEAQHEEFLALRRLVETWPAVAAGRAPRAAARHADGFAVLASDLPPIERRALVLIDPPYEETREDQRRIVEALRSALQRFATGVYAIWYPIKLARDADVLRRALQGAAAGKPLLFSELWLHRLDTHISLNGTGLAIVNPPWQIEARMRVWLGELQALLDPARAGGTRVELHNS